MSMRWPAYADITSSSSLLTGIFGLLHHEEDNHGGAERIFMVHAMLNICRLELRSPCFLVPIHYNAFQRNAIINNNLPCISWAIAWVKFTLNIPVIKKEKTIICGDE
jgi:hypothetical protein